MYQTKCNVTHCNSYKYAKGYCQMHYARLYQYGSPTFRKIFVKWRFNQSKVTVKTTCNVQDCRNWKFSLGFCQMHYTRLRNNGNVNKVIRVVGEERTKNPLYKTYHAMHDRCENPNNTHYEYYGGRGISVCERWSGQQGFPNFLTDMGERPKGMSIDRIDNNGNYEPSNCRWADKPTQQRNQRISVKNTSGYRGVSQYSNGKWTAQIYVKGKKKHLGYFSKKEDAIKARELAEIDK